MNVIPWKKQKSAYEISSLVIWRLIIIIIFSEKKEYLRKCSLAG